MSVQLLLRRRALTKTISSVCPRKTSIRRPYSTTSDAQSLPQDVDFETQAGPSTAALQTLSWTVEDATLSETVDQLIAKSSDASSPPLRENRPKTNSHGVPRSLTRVEKHLSVLQAGYVEPTLADLERCRPKGHAPPESPRYIKQYHALVDTLSRSFTNRQLRDFLLQYGVRGPRTRSRCKKIEYAEAIIEQQWNWPCLANVEKMKRDRTETDIATIPVTSSQLFLILGPDGVNLLKLSTRFNVHISLKKKPLALHVEGVRGSIAQLREEINTLKKNIMDETFFLPGGVPIPSELRQTVSRFAGAYLENVGNKGLIRIVASDARGMARAKRFASRAASEVAEMGQLPLFSYIPTEVTSSASPWVASSHMYSLFPSLSPHTPPWFMHSRDMFRARRVTEWLLMRSPDEVKSTSELATSPTTLRTLAGTTSSLKDILLPHLTPGDGHEVTVKACFGHMLFTAPPGEPRLALLNGQHTYEKIAQWISKHQQPTFVPNLPASLIDSPPSERKVMHRLTYRILPNQPSPISSPSPGLVSLRASYFITFNVVLTQPKFPVLEEDGSTPEHTPGPSPLLATCRKGTEVRLDVMMPDRSMDIRFTACRSKALAEAEHPPQLSEYVSRLQEYLQLEDVDTYLPPPPMAITNQGFIYNLHGYHSVRQETLEAPLKSDATNNTLVSERTLDLDSQQRNTLCEIICSDPVGDSSWQGFLRDCDELSTSRYTAPTGPASMASSPEDEFID